MLCCSYIGAACRIFEGKACGRQLGQQFTMLILALSSVLSEAQPNVAAPVGSAAIVGDTGVQPQSPFIVVARQLVEEECTGIDPSVIDVWTTLQAHCFEAQAAFHAVEQSSRWLALAGLMQGLSALMDDIPVAFQCPLLCTRFFLVAGEWSLALGHPRRARALIQIGNIFKLQAMSRWWTNLPQHPISEGAAAEKATEQQQANSGGRKYESRLQVEYTIAVTQLHSALQVPARPLSRQSQTSGISNLNTDAPPPRLRIEVHSICAYIPDPSSNTVLDSPLPQLSQPNHEAYATLHGYRYVLHTKLPLPDREAHYSKMLVIHEALRATDGPDWVFFIDCDAFFTNPTVTIADILLTYGALTPGGPHFLVAEDPGGINTGTLLFKRSDWSLAFLERVASSRFTIAWDQSMFFWEMLGPRVFQFQAVDGSSAENGLPADFMLPSEVALVHQAHLNAFVQPAARDWSAYEWQPGDVVRHFAGCPWQEPHCLGIMRETADYARKQFELMVGR